MKHIIKITILFVFTILCSCNNRPKNRRNTKSNGNNPTIVIKNLTEEQVLQSVQHHISQSKKTVTISTRFYKSIRKKVPCDQYDIDGGRSCYDKNSVAPYGYRTTTKQIKTCCRSKNKMISTIRGKWITTYIKSSDNWSVELEFKDDKSKKKLKWLVNDKSKKITDI